MSIADAPESLAEVLARLGDIPASRIRWKPYPGTATVQDVVNIRNSEKRLFELVEGVLVEKTMGWRESLIAMEIVKLLATHVDAHDLGAVTGPDGMMQLFAGLVRMPDVAFVTWDRARSANAGSEAAPLMAPDLAVEVLSRSNTDREMQRKLQEYLDSGVRLVWFVDLEARSVTVYDSDGAAKVIDTSGEIEGGAVLPGFSLPVADLCQARSLAARMNHGGNASTTMLPFQAGILPRSVLHGLCAHEYYVRYQHGILNCIARRSRAATKASCLIAESVTLTTVTGTLAKQTCTCH
jgi:Uma2 family endonuclease